MAEGGYLCVPATDPLFGGSVGRARLPHGLDVSAWPLRHAGAARCQLAAGDPLPVNALAERLSSRCADRWPPLSPAAQVQKNAWRSCR